MIAFRDLFYKALWILPLSALLHGCSRRPAPSVVKHHWDETTRDWIIELPESASDQEIFSNYFSVLLLSDGKPIPRIIKSVELRGTSGKVLAAANVPEQQVQTIKHF